MMASHHKKKTHQGLLSYSVVADVAMVHQIPPKNKTREIMRTIAPAIKCFFYDHRPTPVANKD